MIHSIRLRLFVSLFTGVLALSLLALGSLYFTVRLQLRADFDRTLLQRAHALGALIEYQSDGNIDMDFSPEAMPEFGAEHQDQFFEVWMPDGKVLERSPSLGRRDLDRLPAVGDDPQVRDAALFDGRPARAINLTVLPHIELEENPDEARRLSLLRAAARSTDYGPLPAKSPREIEQLTLLCSRADLDRNLANLMAALVLAGAVMTVGVPLLVMAVVRRALQPLDSVAHHAASLDDTRLDARFPQADLPTELQPICDRLNSLLERLHQAFSRERRFTANAAHELRTPIAELRTLAEVALAYPPDAPANRQFYADVLLIATGMEHVVKALLAIARGESAPAAPRIHCDLAALAETVWQPLRAPAAERRLRIDWKTPAAAPLQTDPVLLQAILHNLIANAVEYTPAGGVIHGALEPLTGGWQVRIANDTAELSPEEFANFGEPFWRHETVRGGGAHVGLGLSLVRAFTRALGGNLEFTLRTPTQVEVLLTLPNPPA
ncbi:MAG: ATP-binding protein [Planctomycetota bacterium]